MLVVLLLILYLVAAINSGPSMHNPYFCYTTDPIRSFTNMFGGDTSYEAIRRFNFTTVNRYISSKRRAKTKGLRLLSVSVVFQLVHLQDSGISADMEDPSRRWA